MLRADSPRNALGGGASGCALPGVIPNNAGKAVLIPIREIMLRGGPPVPLKIIRLLLKFEGVKPVDPRFGVASNGTKTRKLIRETKGIPKVE